MHVLIIRLSALGDIIHCLPAVALIKRTIPGCRITWLVEPPGAPLLVNNPVIDDVQILTRKEWLSGISRPIWFPGTAREIAQFFSNLRAKRFDVAVDFQGLMKSSICGFASGAPRRFGFAGAREGAGLLYTDRVNCGDYFGHHTHVVDLNIQLAHQMCHRLGFIADGAPQVEFPLPEPEPDMVREVDEWIGHDAGKARPVAVLIPGTTWNTKIWPKEKWLELVTQLVKPKDTSKPFYRCIIVGGSSETITNREIAKIAASLVGSSDHILDLTGKTKMGHLIELFRLSQVAIGGDTGPLHLAAAVRGASVVAIHGSTPIHRNGPFGYLDNTVALNLPCQPCFEKKCPLGTIACLKDLPPQMVLERIWSVTGTGT